MNKRIGNIFPIFGVILFVLCATFDLSAQIKEPAKWKVSASPKEASVGDEVTLVFEATIDKEWYLYSSDFDEDAGPTVTTIDFEPHSSFELIGDLKAVGAEDKYDEIFEADIRVFYGKGRFEQKVKILAADFKIIGEYDYQVCSDVSGQCIPFSDDFDFAKILKVSEGNEDTVAPTQQEEASPAEPKSDEEEGLEEKKSAVDPTKKLIEEEEVADKETALAPQEVEEEVDPLLQAENERDPLSPYSLLTFAIASFLAGLAALLTPCVFPMIPMTVAFFTGNKSRQKAIIKALVYGFSIILIYTAIGVVVAKINGPGFANWLSTNWVPNVIFSLVFFIFALAFLGLFEITLPSGLVNKVDREADKGGYYGTFFMAFTLVLVSFSCTGPIVGTILVESAGGQTLKPIIGMLAFSAAFAIPFTLFAIFPEWLKSLPKSGGWLNSVKVVLGFLELALALKFLSIADQAYHWNILDREVYLVFWIVIFGLLGIYLLGKLRLPHDDKIETVSVPRLMLAIVTLSFTVYMIPGLWGAPLKALAGYLPPMSTHDFDIPALVREGGNGSGDEAYQLCDPNPKYSDLLHLPHGLKGYFDYEEAMACAKEQGKPLFIDFTGHGCVNCREMEARVWSDPAVLKRLREDFVIVALYVDEKTTLPEEDWYTSEYDGKVKKTIGRQNADFQITKFNNNAQPFYLLLDHDGKLLTRPTAYNKRVSDFVEFLDEGKIKFEERMK
ncbi:MAG: thioredoxin family protein [Cyclobacteriaceae bacterium]|nr:thioredoxin family protein [Cyclobacteriaceae bacterium]MCH8517659.1 thioredoxin family protein [Cyclobacteriaceae bacterium]